MSKKSLLLKFLAWARDLRSKPFLNALREHVKGDVVDIGGGDFYMTIKAMSVNFDSWLTLESNETNMHELHNIRDEKFSFKIGDGCRASEVLKGRTFDSLVNAQVLEHVMEPNRMVEECAKLLKKKGKAIFLIPQTSVIHMAPNHYYNFTRFWIEKIMPQHQLRILELKTMGGFWSTQASHLFYFFLKVFRVSGYSFKEAKRPWPYWLLLPFMMMCAMILLPIHLILSLGDLVEEPNNYLVVPQKK